MLCVLWRGLWDWEALGLLFHSQPSLSHMVQPHPDTLHPSLLQQTLIPAVWIVWFWRGIFHTQSSLLKKWMLSKIR